jgi:cyclophilin family peptidyl-prolyl cis-trans isomerase
MKKSLHALALACAIPTAALCQSLTPACEAAMNSPAPRVKLTTSKGAIVLQLDKEKAPVSTANFVKYVSMGHYDGTIFHRVIDNFMIQGGGMSAGMVEKQTGSPIKNEGSNGLKNDAYTVAMARTSNPDSATAQFFINVKDNDFLNAGPANPGYAVFGKVVDGKDTVDAIKKVPTGNAGPHQNVPTTPVTIQKAECVAPAAGAKK